MFDPKKQSFWVLPGESAGLVYLNGEMVNTPTPFHRDDVLEIGKSKLVLIPFCGFVVASARVTSARRL